MTNGAHFIWMALPMLLAAGSPRDAQEAPPPGRASEELREIRIYVIERANPQRPWKEAIASLTVERPFGRGATYLLPRIPKGAPPTSGPGLIRTLVGTPYFVELNLGEGHRSPGRDDSAPGDPSHPPHSSPAPGGSQPSHSRDVLRQVHEGTYFSRSIPVSIISGTFTAVVTLRLGNLTMTSEEFQFPHDSRESYEQIASRVGENLETLQTRSREGHTFMELRPAVVTLVRNLSRLAPAGFEDGTGSLERDRQWCLAMARGIEDACYAGSNGTIEKLCLDCAPRVREMRSTLLRMAPPPSEGPPPPETPPVK